MVDIGLRELKARASEVVRRVKEQRARYVVTHRGRPVALIVPIENSEVTTPLAGDQPVAWTELVQLGEEIARNWTSPETSQEILDEIRR